MNRQNPTPVNDPIAKFRDPPGEEGSDLPAERPDQWDIHIGLDIPEPKPMSRAEIEMQLYTEGSAGWDPPPDAPALYEDERAAFYEQKQKRLDAEALEAMNPHTANPPVPAPIEERQRRQKPVCGARTRRGTPCQCKRLYNGGRCALHGGLSTGPKTADGKARVALNLPKTGRPGKGS